MEEQRAVEEVLRFVQEMLTQPTRFHLVLVVGTDESRVSRIVHDAATQRGCAVLDMGRNLSEALVSLPEARRALKAGNTVRRLIGEAAAPSAILAVDNTDILFDRQLELNPLDLLADISRTVTLIVAWQGQCTWNEDSLVTSLSHATPDHAEYYAPAHADAAVIVDTERAEEK